MKNLLILLLFLSLFGCNTIIKNKQVSSNFNCPRVYFSSEDRVFVDTIEGRSSIDDVTFKAELNNFAFIDKCYEQNEVVVIPIEILIITQPMDELRKPDISIPIYAALLDQNDKIIETQYFMVNNSIKKNFETKNFMETDIKDNIYIFTKSLETDQVVLGFMLDDKKRLLVN